MPPVVEDERTGIVLVLIPGGEYWMGASFGDGNAEEAESPRRRVRVPPFYLGAGPVMQAEWLRLMETNPSTLTGDRRPVDRVSWLDAQEFLRRANEGRSGPPLRLPIEAEWELAARGGTDTAYWWGPEYRTGWMNCSEDGFGSGIQETTDVGRFPPNPFGLFDILGNLGEWCQDLWKKSYRGAPRFATPQPTGDPTALVIRGGSWLSFPENARVSSRYGYGDKFGSMAIGFRCAQSLPSSRKARRQADERSLT